MRRGLHRAIGLGLGLGLGWAAAPACRVPNPDHCANQDVAGNQFCRETSPGAPFCSPCERTRHGCVRFEPFACGGYDPDPGEVATGTAEDDLPTGTGSEGTD